MRNSLPHERHTDYFVPPWGVGAALALRRTRAIARRLCRRRNAGGSRAAGAGGPRSRCAADERPEADERGPALSSAVHGRSGGRAEAPGRGAHLPRQGARAVARPRVRGAAAREPKASARGAARGNRAAPVHLAMTARRTATNGSDAPFVPLVALAEQFAALSAER